MSVALGSTFGCGDDDDDAATDAGTKDSGPSKAGSKADPDAAADQKLVLRAATFNVGLLDTVGFVPERAPRVRQALATLEADLLCVQEAWQDDHWDEIVEGSAEERPHVMRLDAMPGVQGDCTPEEFEPLRACAEVACPDAGASDLTSCTTAMCDTEVAALSGSCISCLLDNTDTGDLDMIQAACLGSGTGGASGEPVPPEDRSYLQDGSFGIGLLSKYPLMESDTTVLDSSTVRRGILYAKVDVPTLGEVSVFCTHLTAVLGDVTYEGSYETWEGESKAHVKALIDWVDDKAGDDAQVIVMGDLNAGPALAKADIDPEQPEAYAQIPEAGFDVPFLEGPNAACTFCSDNPLVVSDDTGVGAAIDHILTRDIDAEVAVDRIFTTLSAPTSDGDGGMTKALPLSDHYGLSASFFE